MKTDKEYSATHSMSTAWYVADVDGNVAIMDYNEEGPVPWEIEQTSIGELVFGHCENYKTKEYLSIDLTDEQIDELLEKPRQPEEDVFLSYNIFEIDLTQEADFLKLASNPDFSIEKCVSKARGLYLVDCFDSTESSNGKYTIKRGSSLQKMIDKGIVKKLYVERDFFINDVWDGEKVVYKYDFTSAPFFIYAQPYWNYFLAERIITPKHPVKLSQFPLALQKRIPRVPIRFSEYSKFQIAEWHPCRFYESEKRYLDGCKYGLLPLTDGTEAYVLEDFDEIDFYPYCSEKFDNNCIVCSNVCANCCASIFTNKPTVLFIVSPYSPFDYHKLVVSDSIIRHSIIMPYLMKIPKPVNKYYAILDDAKKVVTTEMLEEYYLLNFPYLEDMMIRYNPRVVIIDEKAMSALRKCRRNKLENHVFEIAGKEYPFYLEAEVEENRNDIERLADLPYQGKEFPLVISKEDMEIIGRKEK